MPGTTNTAELFSPATMEWPSAPNLPKNLQGAVADSDSSGDSFYVTGGWDQDAGEYVDDVYFLDTENRRWLHLDQRMTGPRDRPAVLLMLGSFGACTGS